MPNRNNKLICYVAIALFIVFKCFFDTIDSASYAVSLAVLIDAAYDRFLWKIIPIEKIPKIHGTYEEEFHSTHNGGESHTAKAVIRQTRSSIAIHEEVDGSGYSESITATLIKSSPDGVWTLYYTYRTRPGTSSSDDMHEGTAILRVHDNSELSGIYFTNRLNQTKGDIRLRKISS